MEEIKDRKLGDKWEDWDGELTGGEDASEVRGRLFLIITTILLFLFIFLCYFITYLIEPRLASFFVILPWIFYFAVTVISLILVFWLSLIYLSIIFSRNFLFILSNRTNLILYILRPAIFLADKFKIASKDRLSNSFIKVYNKLISLTIRKFLPEDVLILLPRCLAASIRQEIIQLCKTNNIFYKIVEGGNAARHEIIIRKPKGVIAVACERDLISGVSEISGKIPVISVPNCRPNGPCKDTTIDLDEFKLQLQKLLVDKFNIKEK